MSGRILLKLRFGWFQCRHFVDRVHSILHQLARSQDQCWAGTSGMYQKFFNCVHSALPVPKSAGTGTSNMFIKNKIAQHWSRHLPLPKKMWEIHDGGSWQVASNLHESTSTSYHKSSVEVFRVTFEFIGSPSTLNRGIKGTHTNYLTFHTT